MSQVNPIVVPPENPKQITGRCQCGHELVAAMPPIILNNQVQFSSISIPHEQGVECFKCGLYYAKLITNFQLNISLVPVEKPVEAGRIVPATHLVLQ